MQKEEFGTFVATLRKEKEMTQKQLADQLMVSDKAVSKWERGLSFPDIVLLEPLAKCLGVTVTELVECRHSSAEEQAQVQKTEEVLQKALHMNKEQKTEDDIESKKHRTRLFLGLSLIAIFECILVCMTFEQGFWLESGIFLVEPLAFIFGLYFWIFVKETLPAYYDENRITNYSDGFIHMSLGNVAFNNSNWKPIIHAIRKWSLSVMIFYPVLDFIVGKVYKITIGLEYGLGGAIILSVFIPLMIVSKKY